MSILSMEHVDYSYEKMNKKVLRDVSMEFEEGTMYAMMLGGFWCVKRGCRQLPEAVSRSMIRMMMAEMAFILRYFQCFHHHV